MSEKVMCSVSKVVYPIKCMCGYLFDILLGTNSYIEVHCPKCEKAFYICNKHGFKRGFLTVDNYQSHIDDGYSNKNYFEISCLTYGDEIKFHLGEHSYVEFKCPHCGSHMAIKTTADAAKYVKPKFIDKRGFNKNRIC